MTACTSVRLHISPLPSRFALAPFAAICQLGFAPPPLLAVLMHARRQPQAEDQSGRLHDCVAGHRRFQRQVDWRLHGHFLDIRRYHLAVPGPTLHASDCTTVSTASHLLITMLLTVTQGIAGNLIQVFDSCLAPNSAAQ